MTSLRGADKIEVMKKSSCDAAICEKVGRG